MFYRKLFRNVKPEKETTTQESDWINNMAKSIIGIQLRICERLGRAFNRLNVVQKKIVLSVFCLASCIVILIICLERRTDEQSLLSDRHIYFPRHIGSNVRTDKAAIATKIFNRVEQAKQELDSIKRINPAYYDTLIRKNTFLKDSLSLFEELYHSNLNK